MSQYRLLKGKFGALLLKTGEIRKSVAAEVLLLSVKNIRSIFRWIFLGRISQSDVPAAFPTWLHPPSVFTNSVIIEMSHKRGRDPGLSLHLLLSCCVMNATQTSSTSPKTLCFLLRWCLYMWSRHYILIVQLITIEIKYNSSESLRHQFLL